MTFVEKFQKQLQLQGFNPGKPDGDFGPKTYRAATMALNEAGMKDNKEGKKALKNSPAPVERPSRPLPKTKSHKIKIPTTKRRITEIIWHCAATPEGQSIGKNPVATIDRWHRARGWSGIGYHAVVDLDGAIYPGRDWGKSGAHVKGRNKGTLGFSYVGGVAKNGKTAKDTRTDAQRASMLWLTKAVTSKYPIKIIGLSGHNQYSAKACPSFHLPSDELGNIPGFINGQKQ